MTLWFIVGGSLAVAALAAVGYCSFAVFRAVKQVTRDLGAASRTVADAAAPMQAGLAAMQGAGSAAGDRAGPGGTANDR
ncbi:MAG: hypothetical protein ACRDVE_19625 [Actinocrinis sp.]